MVRQATDTAVIASISTPVWPVTLTIACTTRPGSLWSGWTSTAILVIGSGWQSGISLWVCFAAMIPAMRAAPSTSPFLALPCSTRSRVFTVITTRPSATASRSVAGLVETSTMRASPRSPRWVSVGAGFLAGIVTSSSADFATDFLAYFLAGFLVLRAIGSPGGAGAPRRLREQRAGRPFDIALTHQALADEEGADADAREPGEVVGRRDPALADDDAIARYVRRELLARGQRGIEGLEVAVVDPDQPRFQLERTVELVGIVHLEQHVHAERKGGIFERLCRRIV